MKIALAGNPNSGKTTLFNALTGKMEHMGNWSGVTVEKKEAPLSPALDKGDIKGIVIDLPGAYSMSPYTSEESITRDFVQKASPDVIVNVVDAGNLSRSLFFTSQLLELGIPQVIALNKIDSLKKKNIEIDIPALSEEMGCPVVATSATDFKGEKWEELVSTAEKLCRNKNDGLSFGKAPLKTLTEEESIQEDTRRFERVKDVVAVVEKRKKASSGQTAQDIADRIIGHRWLGIPIFAGIIWLVFSISQTWVGPWLADILVGWIDGLYVLADGALSDQMNPVVQSLLLDGIIGGVGAVLGFLPLIMVLFFMLALLEDCGYMARVAVVMDRFFKKIGLSGRSIIPMIISTGCAIPGIMATRTIKNERQRRTTAMLSPFMPCGAKLPIIALISGVFFGQNAWVGTSMYFMAIGVIILSGLIIRQITGDRSKSYFIIELPEYRFPSFKRAALSMLNRARSFIIKAGTIILICNAVVQLLQTFNWQFIPVGEADAAGSILASLATPLAWIFIPLGFGLWQFAAAAITGFIAKENVVGTLAVTFAVTNFIDVEELALVAGGTEVMTVFGITGVAALSYLVFNLFTPPCFAAIGSMNSEMESRKWLWGAIGFQLGLGYVLAFLVYQIGTLFVTGSLGSGFIGGLIAVLVIVGVILFKMIQGSRSVRLEMKKENAA